MDISPEQLGVTPGLGPNAFVWVDNVLNVGLSIFGSAGPEQMIGTVAGHELYHGVTGLGDSLPESPADIMGVDEMSWDDQESGLANNQFTFTYGEANNLLTACTKGGPILPPTMVINDGMDDTDDALVAQASKVSTDDEDVSPALVLRGLDIDKVANNE